MGDHGARGHRRSRNGLRLAVGLATLNPSMAGARLVPRNAPAALKASMGCMGRHAIDGMAIYIARYRGKSSPEDLPSSSSSPVGGGSKPGEGAAAAAG